MSDVFSPRATAIIDRLRATNTSLVDGAKRDSATIARAREQWDLAAKDAAKFALECASLREAVRIKGESLRECQNAVSTLREGHRICEKNMDAEIDRLRELVARYEKDYGKYALKDANA